LQPDIWVDFRGGIANKVPCHYQSKKQGSVCTTANNAAGLLISCASSAPCRVRNDTNERERNPRPLEHFR